VKVNVMLNREFVSRDCSHFPNNFISYTSTIRLSLVLIFDHSQVKSMTLTDTGCDEPLCPYHSWNTTTTFW